MEGITDALDLSVGAHHGCVLKRDASVWCWGNNSEGQLGLGLVEPGRVYAAPVKATLVSWPIKQLVSADDYRSCAILSDQTARCWGGHATDARDLGVRGVVSLSIGWTHMCAVSMPDETVLCWEKNLMARAPRVIRGARQVSAGYDHDCSLLEDGNIVCWASNFVGALGRGILDLKMSDTPTPVATP